MPTREELAAEVQVGVVPSISITPPVETERDRQRAAVEAGLDALDTPVYEYTPWYRTLVSSLFPPLVAVALLVGVWQLLWSRAFWPEYQLPHPADVGSYLVDIFTDGQAWESLWVSGHRALLGFAVAIIVATPLGLLIGTVKPVRAAIGPLVSGLQSLPSVAWVPATILWFGLESSAIYAVILLGAVPSIANGLVAGLDQIPTILPRVGRALGANRVELARHVLLPAALPGFLAGLKQGWAFSWRSLMAAELIANSPQLGIGLGQLLDQARQLNSMARVIAVILLILAVGVVIDLVIFRPLERYVLRARGLTGSAG